MENKINIAELLKDCPKGMELDCALYNKVTLISVDDREDIIFPIIVMREDGYALTLTKCGQYEDADYAQCIIFPKGKTTWEGFVQPCKFKDGDIISNSLATCIFKGEGVIKGTVDYYCGVVLDSFFNFKPKNKGHYGDIDDYSLATEEEKQKLFDAIKANGYKWNAETKTLEKLRQFKVGDRIHNKMYKNHIYDVLSLTDKGYKTKEINAEYSYHILFEEQDNYELIPDKFDINTLKPFDKVLVRGDVGQKWTHDFFGFMDKGFPFVCVGHYVIQCIPYKGNEHLLGTTNDCDEYYKTWRE